MPIEFWPRHNLEMSWNTFDEMQWIFGQETIWNCHRIISTRCNWISAKTIVGIVLEKCRWGAFEL